MDSAGQATSSSFPAQSPVELRARPPSDTVTPASNCRRVGVLTLALPFLLSFIIVLPSSVSRPSRARPSRRDTVSGPLRWECCSLPIRVPRQTDYLTPSESVPTSLEPGREFP